ncbi:MAG: hypothetical protein NC300_02755 [Bacteroidales bacterium]|nr:hypothetical protein [Clostridium sp.]MCM1203039.1 hypothetical protein [Bacteroidales bacterium]
MLLGVLLWILFGAAFTGYGVYAFHAKKEIPLGFWANAKMFAVTNVKAYNRAMGKLWCIFGVVLVILGLPMFTGKTVFILFSTIGVMLEAIVTMVVYVLVIEPKYRKRD